MLISYWSSDVCSSNIIYLFHRFAPELILLPLQSELPEPVFAVAAIVSGVAVGLAAYEIQKIVVHRLVGARPLLTGSATETRRRGWASRKSTNLNSRH